MRLPILMYHMVGETTHDKEKRYSCPSAVFRMQMAYLKIAGYRVMSLDEVITSLMTGTPLSGKPIVITFDDGFRNIYENAFPVLKEYEFPAVIFVVSSLVGRTNEWMTKNGFPERHLASWDELRQMSENGIEVGSHTLTHPSLEIVNTEIMVKEIVISKMEIEQRLQRHVRLFAYPYGQFDETVRAAVATAGYKAACSTRSGFNNNKTDLFSLRRIEIYGTDSLWRFILKIAWGTNDATLMLIVSYYLSRIRERIQRWTSIWI